MEWEETLRAWQLVEELGFDCAGVTDHFMPTSGEGEALDKPFPEAWTLLAGLAARTERMRVAVLVSGNTYRHPVLLAKQAVTLDHITGGRVDFGIGAGWYEAEHRKFGWEFPPPGQRVEMLDEALQVIRSLLTERRTTFHGKHYRLEDAPFQPKPVQERLPILVGGKRPKMLELIARHADLWDSSGTPDDIRRGLATVTANCQAIGRDPAEIGVSVSLGADRLADERGFADLIRAYYAAGARQFLFDFPLGGHELDAAERVARTIIPNLREELA